MDEKLQQVIEQKINETFEKKDEIFQLVKSLEDLSTKKDSFAYGIVVGRLYNSFYYQCKRIIKRNPTQEEFSEFIKILKQRQTQFQENF